MYRLYVWEKVDGAFEALLALNESKDRSALNALAEEYKRIRPDLRIQIEKMGKPILPGGVY